jgi:hypothetical protein
MRNSRSVTVRIEVSKDGQVISRPAGHFLIEIVVHQAPYRSQLKVVCISLHAHSKSYTSCSKTTNGVNVGFPRF